MFIACAAPLWSDTSEHERIAVAERHDVLASLSLQVDIDENVGTGWRATGASPGISLTIKDRLILSSVLGTTIAVNRSAGRWSWFAGVWSGSVTVTSEPASRRHAVSVGYRRSIEAASSPTSPFGEPAYDRVSLGYVYTFIRDPVAFAVGPMATRTRERWPGPGVSTFHSVSLDGTAILVVNDPVAFSLSVSVRVNEAGSGSREWLESRSGRMVGLTVGVRLSGRRWFSSLQKSLSGGVNAISIEGGVEWSHSRDTDGP